MPTEATTDTAAQLLIWAGPALPYLAAIAVVGSAISVVRKQFAAIEFAIIAGVVMFGALGSPSLIAAVEGSPIRGLREIFLWGGMAALMAAGGAIAGVRKKRICFWESFLAAALVVGMSAAYRLLKSDLPEELLGELTFLILMGVGFATIAGWLATKYFDHGLIWWIETQVGIFVVLLFHAIIVGLIKSMGKKEFRWGAFFAGLAVMLLGMAAVAAPIYLAPEKVYLWRDQLIWTGSIATWMVAGFVIGKVGRKLGYWESYLATLILAAIIIVHLAKGWHHIISFGPTDTDANFQFLLPTPLGIKFFGPMWISSVLLGLFASFLLAVFMGSLAVLFFGEDGKLDARFSFERLIGTRHLLSQRQGLISITAVVAILGISLGVAALIAVTAVMSGYQDDIQTKILSTNAHFVVQKYGVDFTEHQDIAKEALEDPEVLAATPFTFNEAMLATADRGVGVLIKGVDPAAAGTVTGIDKNVCHTITLEGICQKYDDDGVHLPELLAERDGVPSVILGSALFKKLEQPVGSFITLTTPIGIAGARGNAPHRMEFRIAGAFRSGMHDFDVRLMYLELGASQQLMGLKGAVNGVEFRVTDPGRVEIIADRVLQAVGRYPYRTLDWRELNIGIFTALKLQKIMMFLVLAFIIVVASFNIASTLFLAVIEKAREIAVIKSMGARDGSIMKVFVLEGWIVGGAGTVLGLIVGLAVCTVLSGWQIAIAADVYMVESLQVQVQPFDVGLTAAAAMVVSHLATLFPALKAARQRPVDAMRYE